MDPKASAKSKRSYSQHGKRNTRPTTAHAQSKNPQQSGDQKSTRLHHPLPTNWDRYDENDVLEGEGSTSVPLHLSKRVADGGDIVVPKSKGADYNYLIEQAQTRPIDHDVRGSTFKGPFSLDYAIPDFTAGLSPMLSARGDSLLSWCADDSFIVDEDVTSSYEVPFLSMDLHALAAQLAKLSMSRRLFIEEDLLPAELDVHGRNESNTMESENFVASKSERKLSLVPQALHGRADAENVAGSQIDSSNRSGTVEEHDISERTGKEVADATYCTQDLKSRRSSDLSSLDQDVGGEFGKSATQLDMNSVAESHRYKTSWLDPVEAAAELDMLLESFRDTETKTLVPKSTSLDAQIDDLIAETKSLGPSGIDYRNKYSSRPEDAVSSRRGLGSSVHVGTSASIDNTIDDVLETKIFGASGMDEGLRNSSATQHQLHNHSSKDAVSSGYGHSSLGYVTASISLDNTIDDLLTETKPVIRSSGIGGEGLSSNSTTELKSHDTSNDLGVPSLRQKHLASTVSLDSAVDDLLAETSSLHKDQKNKGSGSKAIEDFDSWLDSF